jgi:hypothetical protein
MCYCPSMSRYLLLTSALTFALAAPASAGWFDRSDSYLKECEAEAAFRFRTSSGPYFAKHVHLCMLALGYVYLPTCDKTGWLDPNCYRGRWKWEGRPAQPLLR